MTTLHYACSTGNLGVAQWIAEVAPELATALSDVRACVVVGGGSGVGGSNAAVVVVVGGGVDLVVLTC